jgi:hypothetical protein
VSPYVFDGSGEAFTVIDTRARSLSICTPCHRILGTLGDSSRMTRLGDFRHELDD